MVLFYLFVFGCEMIFSQNAPLNKVYEKKTLPLELYLVMNGFSELQKYPKNSSAKKKKFQCSECMYHLSIFS